MKEKTLDLFDDADCYGLHGLFHEFDKAMEAEDIIPNNATGEGVINYEKQIDGFAESFI